MATYIDARVVAVGNPDDPACHFATICKPGSGWHVETISAFDTPAYTGEKVPEQAAPSGTDDHCVQQVHLGTNPRGRPMPGAGRVAA